MTALPHHAFIVLLCVFTTACAPRHTDANTAHTDEKKYIALTYDDGPIPDVTPALLDVLQRYDARATFFPKGTHIQANATLLRRMTAEGHAIGNHALTHQRLTGMTDRAARTEIETVNDLVQTITGQTPNVFRPPGGALNDNVVATAWSHGMAIVMWSMYPELFGRILSSSAISNHVISRARDGDIVFMHDTSMRSVEITETILRDLSAQGFVFVTVPELIRGKGEFVAGRIYETADGDKD